MNKLILTIFLCLIIVGLIACSTQSQERNKNEEKVKKLAENMGADSKDVEKNVKSMSDEELANAAKYIKEDGTLDLENAIQELAKSQSEEQELEANKLPLKEIQVKCHLFQDPASRKYTKTIINLNGCADDGVDYSCKSKSNLNGNIDIKIYGLIEKYPGQSYKTFEKGKLLAEINGAINTVMSLKKTGDGGIFGGISTVYQTEMPQKIATSNVEYSKQDKEKDEYGRKYSRVPFIINAKFVDNNGKEYLYNDNAELYDYSGFEKCEIVSEVTS